MADLPFDEISNEGKWQDLKRMYQAFCDYKQQECFLEELLYKAIPYIPSDVNFVDCSYSKYSLAFDTFIKKCNAKKVEIKECSSQKEFYNVQFKHQEMDMVIHKISEGLKQNNHYNDYLIYVPNTSWIEEFVLKCPFPTNYQFKMVNNRDEAFLEAFYDYDVEKMKQVAYIENEWFREMENCANTRRKELLEEVVSCTFEELPEELDFDTFRLFTKILHSKEAMENNDVYDCIQLFTYQTPIITKSFKHVFCLGLNEDEYPSKISESALILNDELIPFYKDGTPIIRNSNQEWKIISDLLKTSEFYTLSCHFGSLSGDEVLPSLLYKQLLGKQKEKKFNYILPRKQDEISKSFDSSKVCGA